MREIKFRSWNPVWERFVYFKNGKYYGHLDCDQTHRCFEPLFDWNNAEQYTGRKDSTSEFDGIEICEGDIVKPISEDNILARGIVEFDNESGTFIFKNEKGLLQNLFIVYLSSEGFEIICNIHENKDLL